MIFGIKEKSIILTRTVFLLAIDTNIVCYFWLVLWSSVTNCL